MSRGTGSTAREVREPVGEQAVLGAVLAAVGTRAHQAFITMCMSASMVAFADDFVSHDTAKNMSSDETSAIAETETPTGKP